MPLFFELADSFSSAIVDDGTMILLSHGSRPPLTQCLGSNVLNAGDYLEPALPFCLQEVPAAPEEIVVDLVGSGADLGRLSRLRKLLAHRPILTASLISSQLSRRTIN